ncbi:hypothetical protein HLK59_39235 [Streptomyces sp. S3(2020)]|uniref:hypothetical protein n=1 Tax=Streptomyces sp. S3(2020) TaxID=2732044 RepID=UPI00148764AA|nr:hypothetical protein [Streptomyces sp. S3(2020)]NNN36292.1 hypothetical protein [Streptomyces sp. S3(2020)]
MAMLKCWRDLGKLRCGITRIAAVVRAIVTLVGTCGQVRGGPGGSGLAMAAGPAVGSMSMNACPLT